MDGWIDGYHFRLGRPLGHYIFSLIGLMRILFTNIFSEALRGQPSRYQYYNTEPGEAEEHLAGTPPRLETSS